MRTPGFVSWTAAATGLLLAASLQGCHAAAQRGAPALTVNVATYNIRHGRGTDDVLALARTAEVLRRLDADIVALQEVDAGVERSEGVDQAAWLGERLGMHHAFGSFFPYQGGRYGLALLSRRPIRNARELRLTDGNEPRVALVAEVETSGGGTLTVVVVHFDWVAADSFRIVQAEEVARFLDTLPGPWIILGDFNDRPGSPTLALFQARAREAAKPAADRLTFPSTAPGKEIDFIFAAPAARWVVDSVAVITEAVASDHRPVFARLTYRR